VRREAALSLGRIGNGSAAKALLNAVKNDEDPQVRWRAALAFGRIGDPTSALVLRRLLRTEADDTVREHIRNAIENFRTRTPPQVRLKRRRLHRAIRKPPYFA
jgi:HEAT repeat protein